MLFLVLAFSWLLVSATGVSIRECYGTYFAVVENTEANLTCDGYTGTVFWMHRTSYSAHRIGTCNSTCLISSSYPPDILMLSVLSSSSSRLTIGSNVTLRSQGGIIFFCNSAGCSMDIVVNATLGDMSVSLIKNTSGWTVNGSVQITEVFSSQRFYSCVWSRKNETGQYEDIVTKYPFPENNPNRVNKSGSCEYSAAVAVVSGTYTYRVTVFPGAVVKTDSIIVEAPPAPSITCSPAGQYVSEDTELTCTCSGAVGQPPGRLVWFRRDVINVETRLKTGSEGETSLRLTMPVNRSHEGIQLRCDVDWLTNTTGPVYIINVATLPSVPVITRADSGTRSLYLIKDNVTLTCAVTYSGRPAANLTWSGHDDGVVTSSDVTSTSLLLISVNKGDDLRAIKCRADNVFTQLNDVHLEDATTLMVYWADSRQCDNISRRSVIAVSVTLAVVLIVILVCVALLWNRQWILPCAGATRDEGEAETPTTGHNSLGRKIMSCLSLAQCSQHKDTISKNNDRGQSGDGETQDHTPAADSCPGRSPPRGDYDCPGDLDPSIYTGLGDVCLRWSASPR